MGASKQKWTSAEEAALRAGVKKYGLGKWRAIQKDPDFTFLLATRSNVDLKDKWRNMNIGDCGYISREKSLRSPSKLKASRRANEPISALPLAVIPHEHSSGEFRGSSDSPRSLEARCTSMVIDAIMDLNDPNGSTISEIATSIEANQLVPANFRKLLKLKLKEMVKQGGLIKDKDNYKVTDPEESDDDKQMVQVTRKRTRRIVKAKAVEPPPSNGRRHIRQEDCSISDLTLRPPFKLCSKKTRGEKGMEKAMLDVDFARSKLKSAAEAAKAAALAMAEAEAAATAAGKAAKKARAPDAEAEAAEIAAEVAALSRPHKKGTLVVY